MNKSAIKSPTLLLDPHICRSNIRRMVKKAAGKHLTLRPHFKTHQSAQIGEWIKTEGITACTVSSVKMAEYFAAHGWDDILIAFPVNVLESEKINDLGNKLKLQVLVYDKESIKLLSERVDAPIGIKIELDLGSQRSGLRVDQHEEIEELLSLISTIPNFNFTGFYSHPGHTYTARSAGKVREMYEKIIAQLEILKSDFARTPGFSITIGDTPGTTVVQDFGPIEEISPGNFVFYDAMQVNIGSCEYKDIAVVMACPVVGKNIDRKEVLIHGGAVHFSKEVLKDVDGTVHFGKLTNGVDAGWEGVIAGCYLKSISQEHGLIHCSDEFLEQVHIGDLVYIYPAHSCLTADLMKSYVAIDDLSMQGETAFMK